MTAKAVTREYALVALGRYTVNATCLSAHDPTDAFLVGSYPLPAANKITFLQKAFLQLSKDVSLQLSDAAAKILVWRANYGILNLFENSWHSMRRKFLLSTKLPRSGRNYS